MGTATRVRIAERCPGTAVMAITDTMNAISGKWKLPIITTLMFGTKRYKEIERAIPDISPRMLSKELRELEMNGMVTRTVRPSTPVAVEYALTASGETFVDVLDAMVRWGQDHRRRTLGATVEGGEEAP